MFQQRFSQPPAGVDAAGRMPGGVGGGDRGGPCVVVRIAAGTADLGPAEGDFGRYPGRGGAERKGAGQGALETGEQGRCLGACCAVLVASSRGDGELGERSRADRVELAGVLEALALRPDCERCADDLRGCQRLPATEFELGPRRGDRAGPHRVADARGHRIGCREVPLGRVEFPPDKLVARASLEHVKAKNVCSPSSSAALVSSPASVVRPSASAHNATRPISTRPYER